MSSLFKKFYRELKTGLLKVLVGSLNESSLNALIIQLSDPELGVLT